MQRIQIRFGRIVLFIGIAVFIIFYLTPVYMAIITSLKDPATISLSTAWSLPEKPHWKSFPLAMEELGSSFQNSIILAVSATVISSLIGAINGYIFSKWRFKGSELTFTLFLLGMFIPYQIILIPLFQVLKTLHLYGGIPGLILAHVVYGIPITTLIFRNYYVQIPTAVTDSAKVDGAGFFQIFSRIMLPLSLPGFAVTGIWQFTQIWNEFLWGVTLTKKAANPITVGLAYLAGGQAVTWNLPMAGALLAAAPVIIIFIALGRFFIRGLLGGSLKE